MKNLTEIKNCLEYPKDIQDDFLKLSLFAKDHLSFKNDPFLHLKNGVLDNISYKDFLINYINKTIDKPFIKFISEHAEFPSFFLKQELIFLGILNTDTLILYNKIPSKSAAKFNIFKYLYCCQLKN